ncbi:PD-(D/E)XK nuclease family protein [Nocardiopsis akebiae]|uniref:PD-(D/E)XK nuclease family protein n=1 Tax=Nocardiopsis akebiae TaxID=2831968 RepID=UPI0020165D66|nr:PD-(D/E)XK nuclease family protein [Nocardiopsis akebiae]
MPGGNGLLGDGNRPAPEVVAPPRAESAPPPDGNAACRDGGTAPAPAGGALFGSEEALLAAEPRLALAVGLFACGALPAGPDSAVELEVLGPRGASVRSLDPGSARVRATARRVVRELAGPWHGDTSHPPTPGEGCLDCPYRRWCPATGVPDTLHGPGARARDRRGGAAGGPVRAPPRGQAAGSPSSTKR